MKTLSRLVIYLLITIFSLAASAQKFTWEIDFKSVFDNREGDNDYTPTETYFLAQLAPEVGLKFGSRNRIAGGAVWNQPIGKEWRDAKVSPTLYFRHEAPRWSFSMGMFPRKQLHEELPNFLWNDSLSYYQRNIRGALVQYYKGKSFVDLYLDWRQMQTTKGREAFNIVLHGQWQPGKSPFFFGGHAMMNHYALTKNSGPDQHIVDNFVINPYAGADFSHKTVLDSLRVRTGMLMTIERNRANGYWTHPMGFWIDVRAEWRWLGLYNSFYTGQRQQPSRVPFWQPTTIVPSQLYQGEPYYGASLYNRTDLYARIIRSRYVHLTASLDFNVTRTTFTFYQKLTLTLHLP